MRKKTKNRHGGIGLQVLMLLFLLLVGANGAYAQGDCFEYEDDGKTITGLTETGSERTSLTIPATVTKVKSGTFTMAANGLTSLNIENGGNPTFESGLFGENTNTLTMIDMGDGMSVANMIALLQSVGTFKEGTTISAYGFSGNSDATDATWNTVNWANVAYVTLPAELVAPTSYATATVSGRFNINKEIISFCTSATFRDTDNGSNMLFYRADGIADDGRLHIQRVDYVVAGEGVLIHRTASSEGYCDLERYSGSVSYASNMLVGVTEPTRIEKTDGDKTNLVLKDGAFHPTSGGTIGANKAYLQVPSTALAAREILNISFDDETNLIAIPSPRGEGSNYYDLQGRRVSHPTKGLYIMNGKKHVIR